MSIEDRISNMLEGNKTPDAELVKRIQTMLLYDTNQNVPSNFIKEVAKNG